MHVPDDRHETREPRFPAERLVTQFTPQERGLAAAALVAFLGITYFGPALTRLKTPKSRARKLREAAEASRGPCGGVPTRCRGAVPPSPAN